MSAEAAPGPSISDLPDTVLQQVFSYLAARDLLHCETVCRRWLALARDPAVWRHIRIHLEDGLITFFSNGNWKSSSSNCAHFMRSHGRILRNLYLSGYNSHGESFFFINNCLDLHSLLIYRGDLNQELVDYITKNKNLRELKLLYQTGPENTGEPYPVVPFHELPHLDSLHLQGDELLYSEKNRQSLLHCRLRDFVIESTEYISAQYMEDLVASQQQTLTSFRTSCARRLTDRWIRLLVLCPRLKYFSAEDFPLQLSLLCRTLFSSFKVEITNLQVSSEYCSVEANRL